MLCNKINSLKNAYCFLFPFKKSLGGFQECHRWKQHFSALVDASHFCVSWTFNILLSLVNQRHMTWRTENYAAGISTSGKAEGRVCIPLRVLCIWSPGSEPRCSWDRKLLFSLKLMNSSLTSRKYKLPCHRLPPFPDIRAPIPAYHTAAHSPTPRKGWG